MAAIILGEEQQRALLQAARAARLNAYAPYSNFLVGAAVLDEQGQVHAGCNVENAAYPQGVCAEAAALSAMVLAGGRRRHSAAGGGRRAELGDALRRLPAEAARVRRARHARAGGRRPGRAAVVHARGAVAAQLRPRTSEAGMSEDLALARIRALTPEAMPRIAVLLGSGWGGLTRKLAEAQRLSYAELPGFPGAGVAGHAGELWLGRLGAREVVVLSGRRHTYEDGSADGMKGALRTLRALGVQVLVQTNAAGSLDAAMPPGSLMLLSDHLNMVQRSPLVGEAGSERFVDMAQAYDPALRALARAVAAERGVALHEGVYAWVLGPQFETPAEIRMLQTAGRARGGHEHRAGDHPGALAGPARAGAVAGHQPGRRPVRRDPEPCPHAGSGRSRGRAGRRAAGRHRAGDCALRPTWTTSSLRSRRHASRCAAWT